MRSFRDLFDTPFPDIEAVEAEREELLRLLSMSPSDGEYSAIRKRWAHMLAEEERLKQPADTPARFCLSCYAELPCGCAPKTEQVKPAESLAPESKYTRKGRRR